MDLYLRRVASSLLPLSVEQYDLARAFSEWSYSGETIDHEGPIESCQLCGHAALRFHFLIENHSTANSLWVGSECITKFDIPVVADGKTLSGDAAARQVNKDRSKLQEVARKRAVQRSLVELSRRDPDFSKMFDSFVEYHMKNDGLTPKQAGTLLWRAQERGVAVNPRDVKVKLRKGAAKAQIREMEDWKFRQLEPCLTDAQRKVCERIRATRTTA